MRTDYMVTRRSFLRDTITTTLGTLVLGTSSCRDKKNNSRYESDTLGNRGIISYLGQLYRTAEPNQINDEVYEREVERFGHVIREYLPFVNLDNPTAHDKSFICQVNDWDPIVWYLKINPNKLTQEQMKDLNEFNSHKLNQQDIDFIKGFPWLEFNRLTDKDKVWLIQNARATAEAYQQVNTNNINR